MRNKQNTGDPGKKPPPPPAPPRKARELHEFTWRCSYCCTERKHRTGYLFTVYCGPDTLRFCNINCYDKWLEDNPEIKVPPAAPVTDRRGAIAATKAKNEEND